MISIDNWRPYNYYRKTKSDKKKREKNSKRQTLMRYDIYSSVYLERKILDIARSEV